MTATKRDPRTLQPAPTDESWLRGAALIDGAFAAADALNAQLAPPPPVAAAPGRQVATIAAERDERRSA